MNDEKYEFEDWKELVLKAENYYNQQKNFDAFMTIKSPIQLSTEQTVTLGRILHWLRVIKGAGTMKEIRLGSMRYGTKGDTIYTIKFLIDEIENIIEREWYLDSQQDWLNGIYKWHKDNNKNLENSYS